MKRGAWPDARAAAPAGAGAPSWRGAPPVPPPPRLRPRGCCCAGGSRGSSGCSPRCCTVGSGDGLGPAAAAAAACPVLATGLDTTTTTWAPAAAGTAAPLWPLSMRRALRCLAASLAWWPNLLLLWLLRPSLPTPPPLRLPAAVALPSEPSWLPAASWPSLLLGGRAAALSSSCCSIADAMRVAGGLPLPLPQPSCCCSAAPAATDSGKGAGTAAAATAAAAAAPGRWPSVSPC